MRTYAAVLMMLFGLWRPASAQDAGNNVSKSGTSAASFLEIQVGAAAVAMGGAYVSRANDATGLYWNAAGVAHLSRNEVLVSHTAWIADTKFDYAAFVLPLGVSGGVLGLSLTSLSMGDMMVRTVEMPEGTGEFFSASDLAIGVSYARQLTDRFSIGLTGKYIQQSIWHEAAHGIAVDVGTSFRTDLFGGLVIGASLSNFGTSMQLSGRDTRQFNRVDPTIQGSNDRIPYNVELDSWSLPLSFQLGLSTDLSRTENVRWTVAADATHPSDNYESLNVGTEASYREEFFLRAGYHSLFLDKSEGGLSAGAGIAIPTNFNAGSVRADYAFRDMGRLNGVHVFSLAVQF
jgi:hypothetical protein